jgi:hypothetical protein
VQERKFRCPADELSHDVALIYVDLIYPATTTADIRAIIAEIRRRAAR